jgi:5-methylcytosine-specific restriction endonuclease McrA
MRKRLRRPYDSRTLWRRITAQVVARDGGRCRIGLPGCEIVGTTADHILSWREGGSWFGLENLRCACSHCQSVRGAQMQQQKQRPPRKPSREW